MALETLGEIRIGTVNVDKVIRLLVLEALFRSNGNRTDAASMLGVARSTLFEYLKKYHIDTPGTPRGRGKRRKRVVGEVLS